MSGLLFPYAEGTFIPTVTFGAGHASVGVTYAEQLGSYTRIGNRVFGEVRIGLTSKGSSTGALHIDGFPIASAATPLSSAFVGGVNFTAVAVPRATFISATTQTDLADALTGAALTDVNVQNGTYFTFTFNYRI